MEAQQGCNRLGGISLPLGFSKERDKDDSQQQLESLKLHTEEHRPCHYRFNRSHTALLHLNPLPNAICSTLSPVIIRPYFSMCSSSYLQRVCVCVRVCVRVCESVQVLFSLLHTGGGLSVHHTKWSWSWCCQNLEEWPWRALCAGARGSGSSRYRQSQLVRQRGCKNGRWRS